MSFGPGGGWGGGGGGANGDDDENDYSQGWGGVTLTGPDVLAGAKKWGILAILVALLLLSRTD